MKKGIHPDNYRVVAFKDMSNDHVFLCRSAVQTKETIEVDGGQQITTVRTYAGRALAECPPFFDARSVRTERNGRAGRECL